MTEQTVTGTFRNKISTVDEMGKRVWIYPKKPKGKFYTWRTLVSIFLLVLFFAGPFITVYGNPILLFDILGRKFIILGTVFWPQDFHLFGLAVITMIVFIILFTVIFGRIFCGWICPQTVFLEMVFRKIEYWIEGDAHDQKRLNSSPITYEKLLKKTSKHFIYYLLSFIIGNTFLAYIIGKDELIRIITSPPTEHIVGFIIMLIFSFLFYGVFSWFREQVCTLVCPYGRLQGVLSDQDTIMVHYDFKRGEPRGISKKVTQKTTGDCIDCEQCVDVCPTGTDIRNGTQLECVNCTACIDACDAIMGKIQKPKGLIRYSSFNAINNGVKKTLTPRSIGYLTILLLLITFVTILLMNRNPIETTILRIPGTLYQVTAEDTISNLFKIKVVNKTFKSQSIELKLLKPENKLITITNGLIIEKDELGESFFSVELPKKLLTSSKTLITFEISSNSKLIETINSTFLGPVI